MSPLLGMELQDLWPVLLRQNVDVISCCFVAEGSSPHYWVWSYKTSGLCYYVMMLTSSVVVLLQRSHVPTTGYGATRALASRHDVDVISCCLVTEESCHDYWVWSYKSSGLCSYVMMLTSSVVVLLQRSHVQTTGYGATKALA